MNAATDELCTKASRAWFSISNILYTNKRMPISRAIELFDYLVTPVALYATEFWLSCKKSVSHLNTICYSTGSHLNVKELINGCVGCYYLYTVKQVGLQYLGI